jgi:hypothetical protein
MGRTRDVSKILTSNTSILSLASASSIYQTIAKTGLVEITPPTITATGGSGSISATGVVSFTSASAISLNDVFSATYDNYRVLCNITNASADCVIYLKLRAGTDSSAGYYTGGGFGSAANTQGGTAQSNSGNGWQISEADTATASNHLSGFSIDIKLPFASLYTVQSYFGNSVTGAGSIYTNYGGGVHGVATSYNGFTVVASSGNITGTISVYGYNK